MYRTANSPDRGAAAGVQVTGNIFSRFDLVMLDAMNTIFLANGGKYAQYIRVLRGFGVDATPGEVGKTFREVRAHYESLAETAKRKGERYDTPAEMWIRINVGILGRFCRDMNASQLEEIGMQLHQEHMGNPSGFMVRTEMTDFLNMAHGRILLAIASNQYDEKLSRFISHFELGSLVDYAFSSERLGFEKPDPRFFMRLIDVLSADGRRIEPDRMLMVGNNIINDVAGANSAGIRHAILLDWDNEFEGESPIHRISSPLELLRLGF